MTESPRGSQPVRTPAPTGRYPRPSTPPQPTPRKLDTRSRWSARREQVNAEAGPYAGQETRERWLNEHTPLYLHAVKYSQNGKFGAAWRLDLSENDPGEKVVYLTLKANGWRDAFFEGVAHDLAEDPTAIGPLMLVQVDTGGINPAWDLTEWDEGGDSDLHF